MPTRELVGLLGLVLVLSACMSGSPVAPAPTGISTSTRYGAPTVLSARDARAYAANPCALLTEAELDELSLEAPGTQRRSIDVEECAWRTTDNGRLAIAVEADRDLLADTYRTRLLPIFVPTMVEGMPAVRQRRQLDDNTCTVTTGLGPMQALETEWSGLSTRQTEDPCAKAEEAIALVVRKLPPQR